MNSQGKQQKILDLGCGAGDSWRHFGLAAEDWQVVGIDIAIERLQAASRKYSERGWAYIRARGENIPLANESVSQVLCWVALPYMHIPRTVAEIHRVLIPGGWFRAAVHSPGFTWSELRKAFPKPKPTFFRVFVLLNGLVLHFSGRVLSVGKKAESCQTEAGLRLALGRAGFSAIAFRHDGPKFLVEAQKTVLQRLDAKRVA